MASSSFFILILVVSLTLSQLSFSSADRTSSVHLIDNLPPDHQPSVTVTYTTPPTVHLISKMDNGTEPIKITCKVDGKIGADLTLKSGQDLPFKVIVKDTYVCEAIWGLKFASIDAFEPKRDKGHPIIYWRVAKDGFYLSWNKINFKLIAEWESE